MKQNVAEIFRRYGGVMRTSELNHEGLYYKKVKELLEQDQIELIRRGYYQYVGDDIFSDIMILASLFPDGVLCLESALDYYGYTERKPPTWHIAVDSTSTRTRFYIDYPVVKPHFIQKKRYLIGITEAEIDGTRIKVYDRERTICDILYHRNKINVEVFNTAIQRYIKDSKRSSEQLLQYARELHVEKKVQEVLGVWL